MTLDEILKLSESFEKTALEFGEPVKKPNDNLEDQIKKLNEVKLVISDIKKMADMVEQKYKFLKPNFFSRIFDLSYSNAMHDLKKAKSSLEHAIRGLDRIF